jgi:hypothetical protein
MQLIKLLIVGMRIRYCVDVCHDVLPGSFHTSLPLRVTKEPVCSLTP